MRTIDSHRVQFGELAGPLVHGATFFDWQLIATQTVADAFDHPFREILADDGIPFAPVVVETSVHRYPTIEDVVAVEVVPVAAGDSSVRLLYEVVTDDGEKLATALMTHVTIAPNGRAWALPDDVRTAFADAVVDRDASAGPDETAGDADGELLATFSGSFPIRSPHIEGAELAYFEEYPRFADVALEEYLEERGTSLAALSGEKQPFRIRDWRWEFESPVLFESTLRVECDVRAADEDGVRVAHTLTSDDTPSIRGITEYGCFDRAGEPAPFDRDVLALLEA